MPTLPWLASGPGRPWPSSAGQKPLKITDVQDDSHAPAKIRLVVVKVMTSEPGLYGLGCATFTQRARVVETAIDKYLKPFLLGKDPLQIEDIWQSSFVSSYWRNGPVLGNALSGVDMALWDILGKRAGHAGLSTFRRQVPRGRGHLPPRQRARRSRTSRRPSARSWTQGYRHVRVQVAVPGSRPTASAARARADDDSAGQRPAAVWEPRPYVRIVPKLFEHLRKQLGDDVELLHDMHERVPPILAIQLAKDLEPYQACSSSKTRSAPRTSATSRSSASRPARPIAMGELFNNPNEWIVALIATG